MYEHINIGIAVLTNCRYILSPYSYSGDSRKWLRGLNVNGYIFAGLIHCVVNVTEGDLLTWNQRKNTE